MMTISRLVQKTYLFYIENTNCVHIEICLHTALLIHELFIFLQTLCLASHYRFFMRYLFDAHVFLTNQIMFWFSTYVDGDRVMYINPA